MTFLISLDLAHLEESSFHVALHVNFLTSYHVFIVLLQVFLVHDSLKIVYVLYIYKLDLFT
jgi:hypothetical protein